MKDRASRGGGETMRRTKIVCTLGPATDTLPLLQALIAAGMDVARLNFSHGTIAEHGRRIELLRQAAAGAEKDIALMLDTKGPEIRLGTFRQGRVTLKAGDRFVLTTRDVAGDAGKASVSYPGLPADVRPGTVILLADGVIELTVEAADDTDIVCRVVHGGEVSDRKGVNVPGITVDLPAVTEKDIIDIRFGLEMGIDSVAASFIRQAADVLAVRQILEEAGADCDIIAKIENQDAVKNIDEIIRAADGIMVARGDLGVEIGSEEVPLIQKMIIEKCNHAGKPVVTATQMLESMLGSPRPTRAETSDVANAIFDGSDAIMLSGETAAGRYPVEAVRTMDRIARRTESALKFEEILSRKTIGPLRSVTDAIGHATCHTAQDLGASAIITATTSGHTARIIARYRPQCPIIAVTPEDKVVRRLALTWGVVTCKAAPMESTDEMFRVAVQGALDTGLVRPGDLVVITAGIPMGITGTTNLIKVHVVGDVLARGTGIGNKAANGAVRVVRCPLENGGQFAAGDILVTTGTDSSYIPLFRKAAAVVTEEGGLTSHAAIAGMNIGIPVIVGVEGATRLLPEGTLITVDSISGLIYRGLVNVM
jgi:pyruvate kinase